MAMNYREVSAGLRKDPRFEKGAKKVDALVTKLKAQGLLPERIDSDVDQSVVSESYLKAREALGEKGYSILEIPILKVWREPPEELPQEIPQEVFEKLPQTREYLGHLNCSRNSGWFTVSIEVAVNPNELILPGSFNLPQEQQIAMIKKHKEELKKDPRLQGVKVEMSAVSVYEAINKAYQGKYRKPLFRKYEDCVADIADGEKGISVSGLDDRPEFQVKVIDKKDAFDNDLIFRAELTNDPHGWAVPVVVLPQKLAA